MPQYIAKSSNAISSLFHKKINRDYQQKKKEEKKWKNILRRKFYGIVILNILELYNRKALNKNIQGLLNSKFYNYQNKF